jgi:hypothetical protein
MTENVKQRMEIHTADGVETVDADRVLIDGTDYVVLNGTMEVTRIPIADVVNEYDEDGENIGGIRTILSRSTV